MDLYNVGLDEWRNWTTGTFKWLLLKSGSFNPDNTFVSDLVPGTNEISAAGYSRPTMTTPTRVVDNTGNRIYYTCDDPSFGTISTGQFVTAVVLYKFVTNDADSILIGWQTVPPVDTAVDSPLVATVPGGLVNYITQAP